MTDGFPMEPFGFPLEQLRQDVTLGRLEFEAVQWRIGKGMSADGRTLMAVIVEWFFPALPWFKFRMPLDRLSARQFANAILEGLENEPSETEA